MKTDCFTTLSRCSDGEINIILGEDAHRNLHTSLRFADTLAKSGKYKNIVYFNLPFARKRFTEESQKIGISPNIKRMRTYHIETGTLYRSFDTLMENYESTEGIAVIINSWELASMNYGAREKLIFKLHELQMSLGVTFFVFAMAKPGAVTARRLNRANGLGKLSLAAHAVLDLDADDEQIEMTINDAEEVRAEEPLTQNEEITAKPVPENIIPVPIQMIPEEAEPEDMRNISSSNINDLAQADGHLPKKMNRKERRRAIRLAAFGRV